MAEFERLLVADVRPASRPVAQALPLALYLHFPWCVRKCPYCDFNSHTARGELDEMAYVDALIRDLEFELREPEPRALGSIFMGGGTPSLFSGAAIARMLGEVQKRFAFAPDIEITIEANPGAADAKNFRAYHAAGVNRLSIGVQSFDDAQLRRLGRVHAGDEAIRAFDIARHAGFENINLDLMFALSQQTIVQASRDVKQAIALAPEHISYYQLTLEPNTEFAANPPALPDDDTAWTIQQQGQWLLAEHGYRQYEISAYALAGNECRHNRNYWEFGDYLGIGAGAHSKRTHAGGVCVGANGERSFVNESGTAGTLEIVRRARHKHPRHYLQSAGSSAAIQEQRSVSAAELPFEFTMNALRMNEGFKSSDFETRTGLPITALEAGLNLARRDGLIEADTQSLRASEFGRAHLNALLRGFI